ncbi:hypothetical protein [Aulosira sp. FACHB-615]|uniref:hypothetical protein n=1 Tax=Aulosira sp. FACHB-615 TaxID=2692777 RepID=UPI001689DC4E|nr:hypothetical protein [Aulosira sp. FACHB-615]MBD2492595.1 hypothetical protein [Aulosira sp. FACHB-615]
MKTIDLQTKILEELGRGDRFASQLYDALNLRSYQILWQVLGQLSAEGKVKTYFSDQKNGIQASPF